MVKAYYNWFGPIVTEHDVNIDGLRIDAARHIRTDFWQPFAQVAEVLCIEGVFEIMTLQWVQVARTPRLHSELDACTLPSPQNISAPKQP